MIVAIKDHQHKSHALRDALREHGHWIVPVGVPADVLLIDHDVDRPAYRPLIDRYRDMGAAIVLYPHGANVVCSWDGPEEPYPVDGCLVIGTGHRDVMATYGYPRPMHVIGWSFCEQRSFCPRAKIGRVLFAPTHPLGNGYLNNEQRDANREAFMTLLDWGLPLTVRHVGPLDVNGLWREKDVEYEPAQLTLALGSIDEHDLVVARETFLALAIARGIPAVTYHQAEPDNDPHGPDEPMVKVNSWDLYRDLMRYPYDLEDPNARFIATAMEAREYRRRFIGEQLDPKALSDVLTVIVEEAKCLAQ